MSDDYEILVPPSIDESVAGWQISPRLQEAMWGLVRELKSNPSNHLRKAYLPWGPRVNLFSFVLPDDSDALVQHHFSFYFVYTEDEKALAMRDCGYIRVERKPGDGRLPVE